MNPRIIHCLSVVLQSRTPAIRVHCPLESWQRSIKQVRIKNAEMSRRLTLLVTLITTAFLELELGPAAVRAHVSLTFPPARRFNLDYIDNGSPPPCGMPKGIIKTSLVSGSTLNITWHLGYPHQGTHRLELLAGNGTKLYTLVAEEDSNDPTAQRHQVKLPADFTCQDCIVRLFRQSAELGARVPVFRSCADVDIVPEKEYVETCSGNGRARSDGVCGCRPGFWGRHCQYEDECRRHEDCGGAGQGECIDLGGTNLPRRQCFCAYGYIGKKCLRVSQVGRIPLPYKSMLTKEYLNENYLDLKVNKRFKLYWRLIEGDLLQMEFVMRTNGTSYSALGWRPLAFQGDCTRYPDLGVRLEGPVNLGGRSRFKRQANGSGNQTSSLRPPPSAQPQPGRRLHPMACLDVVIGQVRGNLARILDYWSVDISTPKEDTIYDGGSDDVIAGTGWESEDGLTWVVFRVKVDVNDIRDLYNDWPLDEPMFLSWARGQEHGEYVHRLPSGVDEGQPASVPYFYTQDELKYHGAGSGQRAAFSIDFLADDAREYFKKRPYNKNQ